MVYSINAPVKQNKASSLNGLLTLLTYFKY